jgi:hypothetical protein
MAKQERIFPAASGSRYFAFCSGGAIERERPEQAGAGLLEGDGDAAPVQAEPAEMLRELRPVDAGRARPRPQFPDDIPGDALWREQGRLVRDDLPVHEGADPVAEIGLLRGWREIDAGGQPLTPSRRE